MGNNPSNQQNFSKANPSTNRNPISSRIKSNDEQNAYNLSGFNLGVETRMEEVDKYAEIKKSLKFMYKNNFSSASFDDLCAHYIQAAWKNYMINKLIKQNHRGMVEIIFSSMQSNSNSNSKFSQITNVLEGLKLPYRVYDLMEYQDLKTVVNEYSTYDNLPLIFINDYYVGGAKDFQELIDLDYLIPIVNKEYLNNCINCSMIKVKVSEEEPIVCLHCLKPYAFFAKHKQLRNIWNSRNNTNE